MAAAVTVILRHPHGPAAGRTPFPLGEGSDRWSMKRQKWSPQEPKPGFGWGPGSLTSGLTHAGGCCLGRYHQALWLLRAGNQIGRWWGRWERGGAHVTPVNVTLINEDDDGLCGGQRQKRGRGVWDTLGAATRSHAGGKLGEGLASPARPGPGDQTPRSRSPPALGAGGGQVRPGGGRAHDPHSPCPCRSRSLSSDS